MPNARRSTWRKRPRLSTKSLTAWNKIRTTNLILDTTGSVIYCGNHLLHRLRRQMAIVYLAASADEQQLLIRRYLEDPKPVLWRGAFQPKPGETPRDTVARCYPTLIAARRQSYEALAHCTVPVSGLRELSLESGDATASAGERFLERIREQLAHRN